MLCLYKDAVLPVYIGIPIKTLRWSDDSPIFKITIHGKMVFIKTGTSRGVFGHHRRSKGQNRHCISHLGPWFNIKMPFHQYRQSHCGDKTISPPSYLHNGISYTGMMTSLYWISPLFVGVLISTQHIPQGTNLSSTVFLRMIAVNARRSAQNQLRAQYATTS